MDEVSEKKDVPKSKSPVLDKIVMGGLVVALSFGL